MQLKKDKTTLQNLKEALQHEWLETNGLGGWASSSITGCNTRRYHGLLVASIVPPAERMALLSKLDETIILNDQRFELGVNDYGGVIHPNGNQFQASFARDLFPQFMYEAGGVKLRKTIAMVHGENTTLVIYDVIKAGKQFALEILPLISVRGYHRLMHANNSVRLDADFVEHIFRTKAYDGTPDIYIKVPRSEYHHNPDWYFRFNYEIEKSRGLDFAEDLFTYGRFSVNLSEGDSLGIVISTEDPASKDAHELLAREKLRREKLLNDYERDDTLHQLLLASDQFIVKRDEDLKTIIAGYHWFTDWGRDTMISLPGLCLSTRRYDDARKILSAFAKSVSQGMLPNRFQDNGEPPEYNNVDGTLWYFIAIHKYLQATNDLEFVLRELLPVLKDIIQWHFKGTRYNIHAAEDGLLYSGEKGVQLTWMDAKIGDWVVTPRTGKAVEINALWYNALRIYASVMELSGNKSEATEMNQKAIQTRKSFNEQFWNSEKGYLYDVINDGVRDDSLRPNQLFAISLPFSLVDGDRAESIVKIITEKLYVPVGLRSLPADHPSYTPRYEGDPLKRDSIYHQGTAWSWLLGAYVDALIKTGSEKRLAKDVIKNFAYHLNEGCIGSVSEIFDAAAPHSPRGCAAQAWGVAEILRVILDYKLVAEKEKQSIPIRTNLAKIYFY
jgi:predicted glycogen debranching enzyme